MRACLHDLSRQAAEDAVCILYAYYSILKNRIGGGFASGKFSHTGE